MRVQTPDSLDVLVSQMFDRCFNCFTHRQVTSIISQLIGRRILRFLAKAVNQTDPDASASVSRTPSGWRLDLSPGLAYYLE